MAKVEPFRRTHGDLQVLVFLGSCGRDLVSRLGLSDFHGTDLRCGEFLQALELAKVEWSRAL